MTRGPASDGLGVLLASAHARHLVGMDTNHSKCTNLAVRNNQSIVDSTPGNLKLETTIGWDCSGKNCSV